MFEHPVMLLYCRKSKAVTADFPVVISDDEYFSPTDEKELSDSRRFLTNFTADSEEMIDLTVDSSSSSSAVHTPEKSPPYPHIKLFDFLSPDVTSKDLASSIKEKSNFKTQRLSSNVTSSVAESTSAELADTSKVPHYGVTARSPISGSEPTTSVVRQISPPQDPDELKRPALLPPDKRITTSTTVNLLSPLMSPTVSIQKLDSQSTLSLKKYSTSSTIGNTSFNSSKLSLQYKFSPPVEVLSPDKKSNGSPGVNKAASQHSLNVSFPFSPPLTRSQRRKVVEQESLNESKVELFSTKMVSEVDADPAASDVMAVDEPKEGRKKKPKVSSTSEMTTAVKKTYRTRYVP